MALRVGIFGGGIVGGGVYELIARNANRFNITSFYIFILIVIYNNLD
jgi:homoserine dehydrogenase